MLGLGCVPALALAFGMLRMPQSPRWLVMSGDDFAARATLAKIRVDDPDTIDRELEEIKESLDEKPGAWSELLQPVVKAALVVGVGLAILQQVTGINTVIYYAPTIVEFTGVDSSAGSILAAVGVGVINVGMTVLALRLLDRAGRRTLLMVGVSGMVDLALRARRRLHRRRRQHPRLGRRDRQPDGLRRLLRDQPRADLLAAQRRDLPARRAQQGGRAGDDGELDLQLHRLADLPAADRSARAQRRLLVLRRDRHPHPLASAGSSCPRPRASTSRTSRPYFQARVDRRTDARQYERGRATLPADADRRDHRLRRPTFSVEFFPPKTEEATEAAATRRRASWRSWSPTSSRSPTAPAARPATARSRSPRR